MEFGTGVVSITLKPLLENYGKSSQYIEPLNQNEWLKAMKHHMFTIEKYCLDKAGKYSTQFKKFIRNNQCLPGAGV